MTDRRTRAVRDLDVAHGHGLEIGPLHTPIATKGAAQVVYVDLHLTDGLREYYAQHPGLPIEDIVEVDYALIDHTGVRTIAVATADAAPFDWVIASHVIEHVPDLIGWLRDVAEVLVDGGLLSLVIPDRRYTFDALRPPTTAGQLLQAHLDADTRPSVRAIFDHYRDAVSISTLDAWQHGPPGPQARIHDSAYVQTMLDRSLMEGIYVDCHVWLFTPSEFVEQLRLVTELDLANFTVHSVIPTETNDMEFFVTLARIPRDVDEPGRRNLIAAEPDLPAESLPAIGSRRTIEQRAIDVKRWALTITRRAVQRVVRRIDRT